MRLNKHISREELQKILNRENQEYGLNELDDFEKDAIEGWKESGYSISSLKKVDRRFKSKGNIIKLKWGVGMSFIIILAIALYVLLKQNNSSPPQFLIKVDKADLIIPSIIDTLSEIPESKQILYSEVSKSQKTIKQTSTTIANTPIQTPDFALKPLPANIPQKPILQLNQQRAKELILSNLKVIDYSRYRIEKAIPVEQIVLTGLSANYESESSKTNNELTIVTQNIPYTDYLEKTLSFIQQQKWKQALNRLNEILLQYSNDLNAHFYAGWCNYNLGQFQQASTHFSACLQLEFSNFNEEANWYLALSLKASGENSKAKKLFEEIQSQNGYYSNLAEKELLKK